MGQTLDTRFGAQGILFFTVYTLTKVGRNDVTQFISTKAILEYQKVHVHVLHNYNKINSREHYF